MIEVKRHGGGLEYSCTRCDTNEYPGTALLPTRTWWRGKPPKICYKCLRHEVRQPARTQWAFNRIAQAVVECQVELLNPHHLRWWIVDWVGIKVEGVSDGRIAAAVWRILKHEC
ncbi:MAG: hypothetical protein NXI32_04830 [bacterium]|nr:hypothetical protein [bacterium]